MEFPSVRIATERAVSAGLVEVEIVLRCDYLSEEVLLPVVPGWRDFNENPRPQANAVTPAAAAA